MSVTTQLLMHKIKYKFLYKNNMYNIIIEKPVDLFFSDYNSKYIFYNQLKNTYPLKKFFALYGKPSSIDIPLLEKVKIIEITMIDGEEGIFKKGE